MQVKRRNSTKSVKVPVTRLGFFGAVLLVACIVFVGRLLNLQFASRELYADSVSFANTVTVEIPTVRGEITDVSGTPLVSNIITRSITLDKNKLPKDSENASVLGIIDLLERNGMSIPDLLPCSSRAPYGLDGDYYENSDKQRYVKNYARYMGLTYDNLIDEYDSLYEYLIYRYGLLKSDYSDADRRRIVGLRFTLDVNAYSSTLPCVLVENATEQQIGSISDSLHNAPGLEVSVQSKRFYNIDRLASHILGQVGDIYAEDAESYREKGYNLTEKVGKTGVEAAFEEHLRGINGKKTITLDDDGETVLGEEITKEAKPGYTVRLTIDAEMQKIAEDSLEEIITTQAREGKRTLKQYDGEDANAGAVVVLDPRDNAVRVMASYPTYSLNTYSEDIEELLKDEENAPLLNRATGGRYEPGSTYKIATAAAALHYGVTTFDRLIYDKGEFEDYPTYKPHCWVLDRHGYTHGYQTVLTAIQNSCNYYFFRVGKEMGIEKMNEYAKNLGLGVKTGIETGESSGILISPDYKESNGLAWNPGDTLQAAIGQQHLFTPVQIASYISTVLNGGIRYKTHLLDSVVDYSSGEVIEEYESEVLSTASIPDDVLDMLKRAMRRVIDDGTASSTFINYKYPVGGKTGTAQVPGGSDNVIFVGFAPYDNPEIVITVILEHGDKSGNAAKIAKNIFDCYFSRLYPEDFGIVTEEDIPEEEATEEGDYRYDLDFDAEVPYNPDSAE